MVSQRRSAVLYWSVVFGGFLLFVASPFLLLAHWAWVFVCVPILAPWAVWLLNEYWKWVRKL